ncbi:MAG: DegT/DnrJ/EryC1/StrS family aminotransferase [Bryobacteraceae bacterium]
MRSHRLIPPLGVPYGIGDYIAGTLASFRQAPAPPDSLKAVFGDRPLFWTGSGRQALWLILRALNLPAGAGIAVPLFGSTSVPLTISSMGFEPIFLDVQKSTLTVDPADIERIKHRISAIVVEHLFGHLADMPQILEAASGIPVIEDTAQAPLSFLNGRMAGSFGVASFYSFASSKYLPAAGGGLAAINSPDLAVEFARQARQLTPPARLVELRGGVMQAAKAALFRRPFYGLAGHAARSSTKPRSLFTANLDLQAIARGSAAVVLRQADGFAERVREQQSNSLFLIDQLAGIPGIDLPYQPPGAIHNRALFPVLVADSRERDAVRAGMRSSGVDTSRLHSNSPECAQAFGYKGDCPVSEQAASTLVVLPNQAGLSRDDLKRVAASFRAALEAHRSSARRSDQLFRSCNGGFHRETVTNRKRKAVTP